MIEAPSGPTSPRIARLADRLARGEGSALAEFWREVETAGTPTAERAAGSRGQLLVYFAWRDYCNREVALIQDRGADGLVDHPPLG